MNELKGKVALITGATGGIGNEISLTLAKKGMDLALVARNKIELENLCKIIKKNVSNTVLTFSCDARNEKSVKQIVDNTLAKFGRIDVLINTIGIFPLSARVDVSQVSTEDWRKIIETNLYTTYFFCKFVIPIMRKQKEGYIINISSISGKKGFARRAVYSASKFGLVGFSYSILKEVLKDGIRVSVVCPGIVRTKFHPPEIIGKLEDKILTPHDVAEVIVFLLTRESYVVIPEIIMCSSEQEECFDF